MRAVTLSALRVEPSPKWNLHILGDRRAGWGCPRQSGLACLLPRACECWSGYLGANKGRSTQEYKRSGSHDCRRVRWGRITAPRRVIGWFGNV